MAASSSQSASFAITRQQLVELLRPARTQPATLVTRTEPRMRRTGNPYLARGVVRIARRNGFLGADYARVINRQRAREAARRDAPATFPLLVAEQLWRGAGQHVPGHRHLVRHTGTGAMYLVFYPQHTLQDRYEYADTGRGIPRSRIARWLYESRPASRAGTDKPIHWRTFALEHVLQITLGGATYDLEPILRQIGPAHGVYGAISGTDQSL